MGVPVSDMVAVTKKAIKAGEAVDGIGGYCVRGVIAKHTEVLEKGFIPIGLVTGKTIAKRDIPEGTFLTEDDIELDKTTTVYRLRKMQDEMIG